MAKRFKLRICRVIATTMQSCRSKDPSNLPKDPVPSFSHLSKFSALQFSHPRAVSHHVSSTFISIGSALPAADADANHPPQFKWQKEDNWHVVAKIHHPRHKTPNSAVTCGDSDADDGLVLSQPTPPPPEKNHHNRRRAKKKRNIPSRLRLSTSSADSGWFSSEGSGAVAAAGDEETETLVSSSPGSSSELHPIRETQAFTAAASRRSRRSSRSSSKSAKRCVVRQPSPAAAAEGETPARLSMFKKLIPCTVDGKVKESFAIVKRSEDPYEDFKSSMMDMIVEKQMFEQKDLEQLLQCFLSLNSRNYHGIIIEAFSEIWATMFSPADSKAVGGHYRRRVSRVASL